MLVHSLTRVELELCARSWRAFGEITTDHVGLYFTLHGTQYNTVTVLILNQTIMHRHLLSGQPLGEITTDLLRICQVAGTWNFELYFTVHCTQHNTVTVLIL